MKKRFTALLLSVMMLISIIPSPVFAQQTEEILPEEDVNAQIEETVSEEEVIPEENPAEEIVSVQTEPNVLIADGEYVASGTCGTNLTWTLDSEGTLTISGTGAMKNWSTQGQTPWYQNRKEIKSVVIEEGVTSIGSWAFERCSSVTNVTIPDSVTNIGEYGFAGCSSLTSIKIPEEMTNIGEMTFYYCTSLTEITIPDSVTKIGKWAFIECYGLKSITLGKHVEIIDEGAFNNCTSLVSISIPESVKSIGDYAFGYCEALTNVTIPKDVITIGSNPFENSTSLVKIEVDEENTAYSSDEQGILYNKDKTMLIGCPAGISGSVVVPDSVTSICENAFSGCSSLASVTIPGSVTSIGEWAFNGCENITDVYYGGSKADWGKIYIGNGNEYLNAATKHYAKVGIESIEIDDIVLFEGLSGSLSGHWDDSLQEWIEDSWFCYDISPENIKINYDDGSSREFADEYELYDATGNWMNVTSDQSYENQWEAGEHKVTVTYMDYSAEYSVVVKSNPISKIEFVKNPDKSTFYENEYIDLQGAVIRVIYDNRRYEDIELKYPTLDVYENMYYYSEYFDKELKLSLSDDSIETAGKYMLEVYYANEMFQYPIEIVESDVLAISIASGGRDLIITAENSDGSYTEMTALAYDPRKGDVLEGDVVFSAGYLITDKGSFYAGIYEYTDGSICVEMRLGSDGEMLQSNKIRNCEWIKWQEIYQRIPVALEGTQRSYWGIVTSDNIEDLISTSIYYNRFLWNNGYGGKEIEYTYEGEYVAYKEDDVRYCLENMYGLKDVELTLFERYDSTTGNIYMFGGYGGAPYRIPVSIQEYDGNIEISTYTYNNLYIRYVMNEDDKIVRFCVYDANHDCNYKEVVTEPTCAKNGYTLHICEICMDCYKDSYTNTVGHSWDDGTPDAENPDVKTFTCTVCGETVEGTKAFLFMMKIHEFDGIELTHSHEETVLALKEEYEALTEEEQSLVENYDELEEMIKTFEHYHKGDIDLSGTINSTDLSELLSVYGTGKGISDINGDGLVNSTDLSTLLAGYGTKR